MPCHDPDKTVHNNTTAIQETVVTVKSPQPGDLEPIEKASRDEIAALQLKRLQWSVRHTYDNVAPYREKCQQKGVHPDDLRHLEDLAKFPFMTKLDLRDHYPFGLFAVPREKIARLHASSGTTGKSVVVGYTKKDLDVWADVMARSLRAAGVRAGDGSPAVRTRAPGRPGVAQRGCAASRRSGWPAHSGAGTGWLPETHSRSGAGAAA